VLIILFAITRMPGNPITGRGGPISPMALAIEVFQAAFIGLCVAIIVYEMKRKQLSGKTASETAWPIGLGSSQHSDDRESQYSPGIIY
jgi:hypothetical protein